MSAKQNLPFSPQALDPGPLAGETTPLRKLLPPAGASAADSLERTCWMWWPLCLDKEKLMIFALKPVNCNVRRGYVRGPRGGIRLEECPGEG